MADIDETRLEDYLADQFQTTADLSNIDNLLQTVALQRKQLEEQLRDARSKLALSKKTAEQNESTIIKQAKEFEAQQAEVQRRLLMVTSSDSVDEATRRLRGPLEQLRKVELAKQYVDLLKDVDELVIAARKHLPQSPKNALEPYTRLKELSMSLHQKQEIAEGAGIHLVDHVEGTTERLWLEMKKIMSDEFRSVLAASKWPKQLADPTTEWIECFHKLLDLQYPELLAAIDSELVLLPIEVLAKPFVQLFRYNFMSEKPTSDLHYLAELFTDWVPTEVAKLENFLRSNVTPILAAHFEGTDLANEIIYVDAVSSFITALLPVTREKVHAVLAAIPTTEPGWLSKFIDQLLTFDEVLRSQFNYFGHNLDNGWEGLTGDVLGNSFNRWLGVEKDFTLARYHSILKASNSGQIDYDSTASGTTKATYGARQVTDLLETVTHSYSRLRRFTYKTRFLVEIQAEILDRYQGRLAESLDAYRTTISSVARRVHGISREEKVKLQGIGGLDSLCRVFGSATHIIDTLEDWGNTDFFFNLWQELQSRAKMVPGENDLAGALPFNVIREATSAEVGTDSNDGSVFDVAIAGFDRLRADSRGLIVDAFTYRLPSLFWQYTTKAQWTTIGELDDSMAISSELDQPLKTLKEELGFLSKALAYGPFRRILIPVYSSLEDLLWKEVLTKQQFTSLGAASFALDVQAIQTVVDSTMAAYRPGAKVTMPKLLAGLRLLNLPLEGEEITLSIAYQAIFDPSSHAAMLEKLGCHRLSVLEARAILQSRLESQDLM